MGHNRSIPWLCLLCAILALALLVLLFLTAFVHSLLGSIRQPEPPAGTLPPQQADIPVLGTSGISLPSPSDQEKAGQPLNILLIGQDRRPGETQARSDAMILCSIRQDTGTVTLISFLRDTYLSIPGYKAHRLNSAFQWGGMALLERTLEENFAIGIDGAMAVDFNGFQGIIDLLGGVDLQLTREEADHMSAQDGWSLSEGANHLNGEQALFYSRIRVIDSDFGRTQRQRNVLCAILNGLQNADLPTMFSLSRELLPLVSTDMEASQLLQLAAQILPICGDLTVVSAQIPAAGTYRDATVSGMAVLVPDLEQNRQLLQTLLEGA